MTAGNNKQEAAVISSDDPEPVVGFASFLPEKEWKVVRLCTADWIVRAKTYADTVWVSREDILDCFEHTYAPSRYHALPIPYFAFALSHYCLPGVTIAYDFFVHVDCSC